MQRLIADQDFDHRILRAVVRFSAGKQQYEFCNRLRKRHGLRHDDDARHRQASIESRCSCLVHRFVILREKNRIVIRDPL